MRIVAIVQARMGSTRLPGKVLKDIAGKPALWHVINRLKESRLIDEIVIATTVKAEDQAIVTLAADSGVKSYSGSEDDVLDRYFQAAKKYCADVIVRVTSDCPLLDPDIVDDVVKYFLENCYDYVSNTWASAQGDSKQTYPVGLDTEVFSFKVLERAWTDAKLPSEREHVTPFIWKNFALFRIGHVDNDEDLYYMRWTLDYERDLLFIREVYKQLSSKGLTFRSNEIISLLEKNPELLELNKGVVKNEGYFKSLEKDKQCSIK
jgi:spore coat polysaccharide biosynthesis protein SpsF (cytidylyltransferase family)